VEKEAEKKNRKRTTLLTQTTQNKKVRDLALAQLHDGYEKEARGSPQSKENIFKKIKFISFSLFFKLLCALK